MNQGIVTSSQTRLANFAVISGANTGLSGPLGIAIDANDNIYVANLLGGTVTVYAANSNGNATPISTISSPTLQAPEGVALDSQGKIYVTNNPQLGPYRPSVVVFAPGSNGNVTPIETISGNATGLNNPLGIVILP